MNDMIGKLEQAEKLAQERWSRHPNPEHPDACEGLAQFVASYCDISIDQAWGVVSRVVPVSASSDLADGTDGG